MKKCVKYEYDIDGQLIYLGEHDHINPSDDFGDWKITKFTWSSGSLIKKQTRDGSWTTRTSYFS